MDWGELNSHRGSQLLEPRQFGDEGIRQQSIPGTPMGGEGMTSRIASAARESTSSLSGSPSCART
eukprot:7975556-Pyramimonas_sp.AAC.1